MPHRVATRVAFYFGAKKLSELTIEAESWYDAHQFLQSLDLGVIGATSYRTSNDEHIGLRTDVVLSWEGTDYGERPNRRMMVFERGARAAIPRSDYDTNRLLRSLELVTQRR